MSTIIAVLQRITSPPAQSLHTLQPTSSTVTYTVSTRTVPKTLPAILGYYLSIALRILLGLSLTVLSWTKWRITWGKTTSPLQWTIGSAGEAALVQAVESVPWKYFAPGALALLWLAFRRGYTEESLTVLHGLGLQTSTVSSVYLRTPNTRFIPTTSIQDVFIHEAFKGFEVRFYLAVVVKGEEDVVVVFPRLLPCREVLEEVWRGARACLYEGTGQKRESVEKAS